MVETENIEEEVVVDELVVKEGRGDIATQEECMVIYEKEAGQQLENGMGRNSI